MECKKVDNKVDMSKFLNLDENSCKHINKMRTLDQKCFKIFKAQIEVEKCMLLNKLIRKRERGDIIYRINLEEKFTSLR